MPRLNLNPNPRHVYCDFEYRSRDDGSQQLILGCFYVHELDRWIDIDFRDLARGRSELCALYHRYKSDIFLTFGGWEIAEIQCFEVAGINVLGMHWIDLYTESNQVTGSHDDFWLPTDRRGLLAVLDKFDIATRGSSIHKQQTVDRIVVNDQYTDDEWRTIVDYCHSDIEPLPLLYQRVMRMLQTPNRQVPYTEASALFHGDYLVAQAHLDARSRGFPIDVKLLDRITTHRKAICNLLAEDCNRYFQTTLYRYVKRTDSYSFNEMALRQLAHREDALTRWEPTRTGRLRKAEDYLDEFCKANPYFQPLIETRRTLQQLRNIDLHAKLRHGFIKGINAPLHAITGRNQPMASKGMILNLCSWQRCLMRPHQGHIILAGDWSQQEIVIAAALSGDEPLCQAIESGDVYLALAKLAHHVPTDATTASHPLARQLFKSLQLGIGYGMGRAAVASKIYTDLLALGGDISFDEAMDRAVELLSWHKRTFHHFWHWQADRIAQARKDKCIYTADQWTLFVDRWLKSTTIGNFPMQAGGATILREAIKLLAKEDDVELIASHHDAIYLYAREEDQAAQTAKLERCMTQAVERLMQVAKRPMAIKIKTEVYDHLHGYHDPRGAKIYARVMDMIASIEQQSAEQSLLVF